MAVRINLHVGVHKTATTFMQNWMRDSRESLSAKRVGYLPLGLLRNALTGRLGDVADGRAWLDENAKDFFTGDVPDQADMRLVISDENLVGQCGMLLNSGIAFETGANRLRRVRSIFADAEITLWCAIRSYSSFLPSAYCEGLRNNGQFVPFRTFVERLDVEALRWGRVVASFEDALRPQKTIVWRYEDVLANATEITRSLAFGAELSEAARPQQDESRPSFSHAAVDLLEYAHEAFGPAAASRLIESVSSSLPKAAGYPAYDPWERFEKLQLEAWYRQDCEDLKSRGWLLDF